MPKFEYTSKKIRNYSDVLRHLNTWGEEGWQVVYMETYKDISTVIPPEYAQNTQPFDEATIVTNVILMRQKDEEK
jgi:hypothetical protein